MDRLSPEDEYTRVFAQTKAEFPQFKIVPKSSSTLMKIISYLLFFNKTFMTGYATTIGYTVYVTPGWVDSGYSNAALLRHERVHMRQAKKYGLFFYAILYLLVLPAVWTFRAKFEKEAYEESIRAWYEYGGENMFTLKRKDHLIKQFTSGAYGWMCPFQDKMERWYDVAVDRAKKGL